MLHLSFTLPYFPFLHAECFPHTSLHPLPPSLIHLFTSTFELLLGSGYCAWCRRRSREQVISVERVVSPQKPEECRGRAEETHQPVQGGWWGLLGEADVWGLEDAWELGKKGGKEQWSRTAFYSMLRSLEDSGKGKEEPGETGSLNRWVCWKNEIARPWSKSGRWFVLLWESGPEVMDANEWEFCNITCNSVDGQRDDHTKWNKSHRARQKHMISLVYGI